MAIRARLAVLALALALPVVPATAASAADVAATPLYLHSANNGYLADSTDDPGATAGLRAPRGSTASATSPTGTTDATAVYANGTVPGNPATPTFSLPPALAGTVHGACLDLWLSKAGGTAPQQVDVILGFKGTGSSSAYTMDALSVYYTPGSLAHVVGYVRNPVGGDYQMAKNAGVYLSSYVDADQALTLAYDSVDHPSRIILNADPVTCPTPPAPPPEPFRLLGADRPAYDTFPVPASLPRTAKQPSLGIDWSTGTAVVQAGTATLRAEGFDDPAGPVWAAATPPVAGVVSVEPSALTSPYTRRTYVSQVVAGCGDLAVSDDSTRHWLENPAGCGVAGLQEHVIGAGPFASPKPAAATFREAVWYCAHANAATTCAQSGDGGLTFGPARQLFPTAACDPAPGRPVVAPDGTVYVPNRDCGSLQSVIVSEDNGATWTVRPIPGSVKSEESMPSVAVASDGTVYAAFERADGAGSKAFAAVSRDHGRTWRWLRDVGSDGAVYNAQFPVAVAGDADRAAVAFLGTPAIGNDQDSTFGGDWHLYVATTATGGHDWTTVDVTPDDPVQRGCILTTSASSNLNGTGLGCDNLGRYISATVDREGRVLVAYADGCVSQCVEVYAPSTSAVVTVARQSAGLRLFEPARPSVPDVVRSTAEVGDGVVHLGWTPPGGNGRPISGYTIYRDVLPNPQTVLAQVGPTTTAYEDTSVTKGLTYYYTVGASNLVGAGEHYDEHSVVAYVPGAVDAGASRVSALPGAVPANGTTTAAITVDLRDVNGHGVSGKNVTLSASGPGSPVISPSSATTSKDGRAVFGVRSVTAGHVTFTATDVTDGVTVTQTAAVDFLAGAVDSANSTLTASPTSVVANGTAASTVTATLRDANGNGVPGQTVVVQQTTGSGNPDISPASARTDANGVATFAVTSTVAASGSYTATDTTDGTVLAQHPTITFVAGPATTAQSTLAVDAATVPSDGTSLATFTATLRDAQGNAAGGRSVTLTRLTGPGTPTIAPAGATTDANGVATFTARTTTAGAYTFSVGDSTDGISTNAVQVTYAVGAVSASVSGLTATPSSVVADGTAASTLRATLRDGNGNAVAGRTVTLAQTAGGGLPSISPASVVTDANGQAAFTVTATTAATMTFRATDTTDGVAVTQTAAVTFVAGPVSAAMSSLTAAPATLVADGVAASTFTATLRDAYGNEVSGKTVTLAKTSGPGSPTIAPASATTDATGVATFTAKSTVAGTVTFRATDTTDGVAVNQTADVVFQAGPVSASVSGVTATPSSLVADGTTTTTVVVTLRDANTNAVAGKTVTLTKASGPGTPVISPSSAVTSSSGQATFTVASTTAGAVTLRGRDTDDALDVTQTPTVTFQPGAVSAATSGLLAAPGTVAADGVATSTLTATLRDANGNAVPGKTVTLAKTAGPGTPAIAPSSATSDPAGQAAFTVKSTVAGVVTFRATDSTDTVTVTQTADVTFQVGAVSASVSGVTGTPSSVVADGSATTALVATLRDANGNVVSGKTVTMVKATGTGAVTIAPGSAVTNASGQASFTASTTVAGGYTFRATDTTDNVTVTATASVTFTAGPATAGGSSVTSSGNVPNDGTTTATVTVVLRDANANLASGRTVTLAKTAGGGTPVISPASRVTDATGTATFSVSSSTAASNTFQATDSTDGVTVTQTADVTFVPPPDVPTGLTATPGNAQVALSWTAAPGGTTPTDYRIYQGGSLVKTVAAPATSTTVTGLTDGTTYSFQVSAYSTTYRESAKTGSVTATPRAVPGVPTGLTATPGDTVVSLSWTAPAGTTPTEYRVWENGTMVATVAAPATTAQRTGRTNGQAYSYEVQAYATNYGTSAKTATVSATPVGAPATPASLVATPGDGQVVLTWTAPTSTSANPVSGQRVYLDGSGTPAATLAANAATYTVSGLTNFTGHTFVVASYNGTAESRTASVAATPTAPPTALTVGSVGTSTVALSWTAPSGSVTGYRVYVDNAVYATVATTSTTLTGLAGATTYSIQVSAVNSATPVAESARTGAVSVLTKPAVPTGVTAATGNRQLTVSWTAPAGGTPTGYRVYLDGALAATVSGTSTTLTGLVNGQTYQVTMLAYNATGDSATTTAVAGTPTLPTPVFYSLTDVGTDGVDVTVTYVFYDVANASGYRLYRDGTLVTSTSTVFLSGRHKMVDTGRSFTTAYNYTVAAVDGTYVGPQSEVHALTTRPDDVPSSLAVTYLCGSVANTYKLKFTWSAPVKGTWTGFRIYNADGTVSSTVGSTIRTYTTGNQTETPDGSGGFTYYSSFYTVNTPSTTETSGGYNPQGTTSTNC